MSISVIDYVWKNSTRKGAALLVLLAIADFADETGLAFPAIKTLAVKARVSERGVQYVLRELVSVGELSIEANAGPKGCNKFRVHLVHGEKIAPVQTVQGATSDTVGVQSDAKRGAKLLHPNRKEPSKEPSKKNAADDPRRAPFLTFAFTAYVERFGELVPDQSDFKALKDLLAKTKAELSEFQRRWVAFLDSDKPFHREQGHPLRWFCTNWNAFSGPSRASPKHVHSERCKEYGFCPEAR